MAKIFMAKILWQMKLSLRPVRDMPKPTLGPTIPCGFLNGLRLIVRTAVLRIWSLQGPRNASRHPCCTRDQPSASFSGRAQNVNPAQGCPTPNPLLMGIPPRRVSPRDSPSISLGRGCRGAMIPAKMISKPQDLQNYLPALQNWSPSLSDVTKPPAILSLRPTFWLQ